MGSGVEHQVAKEPTTAEECEQTPRRSGSAEHTGPLPVRALRRRRAVMDWSGRWVLAIASERVGLDSSWSSRTHSRAARYWPPFANGRSAKLRTEPIHRVRANRLRCLWYVAPPILQPCDDLWLQDAVHPLHPLHLSLPSQRQEVRRLAGPAAGPERVEVDTLVDEVAERPSAATARTCVVDDHAIRPAVCRVAHLDRPPQMPGQLIQPHAFLTAAALPRLGEIVANHAPRQVTYLDPAHGRRQHLPRPGGAGVRQRHQQPSTSLADPRRVRAELHFSRQQPPTLRFHHNQMRPGVELQVRPPSVVTCLHPHGRSSDLTGRQ
jgi:hypothetical protein